MVDLNKMFATEALIEDPRIAKPSKKQLEAIDVLVRAHKERAAEEALFRALSAEKIDDVKMSFFWIGVYVEIKSGDFKT